MCPFNGANICLGTKAPYKGALLKRQSRHALRGTLESWLLAPADQGNPVGLGLLFACLLRLPCTMHPLLSRKPVKRMIKTTVTSELCACYVQR